MKTWFAAFARSIATVAGHPVAFLLAVLAVLGWAAAGPFVHYSEGWQLCINTSTTILTFLMVFLLQHSQNHDTRTIQVKLDELIRAVQGARNELINLEELSEEELARYCTEFRELQARYAATLSRRVNPEAGGPAGPQPRVAPHPLARSPGLPADRAAAGPGRTRPARRTGKGGAAFPPARAG